MLIAYGLSARPDSKLNWLGNIVSLPLTPFQKLLTIAGEKVEESFSFISEAKVLRQENEELREKINELENEIREIEELRIQNQEFKEILNYKERFNDYEFIGGNVIAKDAGNWFNVFTIDIGSSDGIDMSRKGLYSGYYPVVSGAGLVGRVIMAYPFSSKVLSIIDEDSVVSAIITKNRSLVEVKGDIALKESGLCIVENIKTGDESSIAPGDTVETSGMGGIFPKGIIIGKIKEVRRDDNNKGTYAILEPAVDFKRIETVFVMKSIINDDGMESAAE